MRRYTKLDLIRFHKMASNNENANIVDLIKVYDKKHPQLSVKEQMINLVNAINSFDEEE